MRTPLRYRSGLLALAALLGLAAGPPATATHPFYEGLLRDGTVALERDQSAAAARDLRLAAFGLLDEPPRLAEALMKLAVAEAGLADEQRVVEVLGRLVDLEERFGAVSATELPAPLQSRFEAAALRYGPDSLLSAVPAFAALVERRAQSRQPAERERRRRGGTTPNAVVSTVAEPESEQPAVPGPQDAIGEVAAGGKAVETGARGDHPPDATNGQADVPAHATEPAAPSPAVLSTEEQASLEKARHLLARARRAGDLDEALAAARAVADAHPEHARAQELAGEIAYRSSRFAEAARFFDRLPLAATRERPELAFYMAVALYETGQEKRARGILEGALPLIERTAFVEGYVRKILGGTPLP
jgi:tetratricopeptide (TPR) repeat protein